ncbi:hypothetical protein [Chryseobacterium pennipullorum]|uniref:Uncharacterized protein n=1 Tax=Chryseobacterium pennipullorum TaxID=2258963 RepID=A0A3D9B5W5_9FLAO|nr:hypothetical protein [Chryseobacterium pennipullorum]REC48839.1 hypothetical protein DRF67_04590 [Chryseobacterium pennipullorum]
MINKEKAFEIVKQYLQDRKREYVFIVEKDKCFLPQPLMVMLKNGKKNHKSLQIYKIILIFNLVSS